MIDYASDILKGEETHLFVALQGEISHNKNFSVEITYLHEEQKFLLWTLLSTDKVEVIRADYPYSDQVDPKRSTIMFREKNSSLTFMAIPREFLQWRGYASESREQKDMMNTLADTLARIINESSRETWRFGSGRINSGLMTCMYLNTKEYVGHDKPKCPFQLLKNFENSVEFSELKRRTWYADYRERNPGSDLY